MNAAKKDFSQINTNRMYNDLQNAMEVQEEETTPVTQEVQLGNPATARRPRKTYTDEELKDFGNMMKTAGRKGAKLPRINLAFTPDNYAYIQTMSKQAGISMTEFINQVIAQSLEDNRDLYERALQFRTEIKL